MVCDYQEKETGWQNYQQMWQEGKLEKKKKKKEAEEDKSEEEDENSDFPVLACDHSAITGESLAVDRYAGDDVFYTTGCKRGKAYAIVQSTGTKTFEYFAHLCTLSLITDDVCHSFLYVPHCVRSDVVASPREDPL